MTYHVSFRQGCQITHLADLGHWRWEVKGLCQPVIEYLVEKHHGVEVSIALPDHALADLAQGLAPLFDPHFGVLVHVVLGVLVPLLDLQHVQHKDLVKLLAQILAGRGCITLAVSARS